MTMQIRSRHPAAALSWATVLLVLALLAVQPSAGASVVLAVLAAVLVAWRFPPRRTLRAGGPGALLRTTSVDPRPCDPARLRPQLVRDLEFVAGLTPAEPQTLTLQATEVALHAMRRGGVTDPRRLTERDVVALSLLRDAILSEPAKAARLADAFHDPASVLDLRDRVRSGTVYAVRPRRAA
jgi:hypothetical protein